MITNINRWPLTISRLVCMVALWIKSWSGSNSEKVFGFWPLSVCRADKKQMQAVGAWALKNTKVHLPMSFPSTMLLKNHDHTIKSVMFHSLWIFLSGHFQNYPLYHKRCRYICWNFDWRAETQLKFKVKEPVTRQN